MPIRNCRKCRKVFNHPSSAICPECKREEERVFEKVRDYLRENREASINEVSERTGVSIKTINRYIREGRLLASGIITSFKVDCEGCGIPIDSGKYCEKCRDLLAKDIDGGRGKPREAQEKDKKIIRKKSKKMHLADRIKDRKG